MGDYVDRGPNSFGFVQLIRHCLAAEYPVFTSIINLKGNHEAMMAEAALGDDRGAMEIWVDPDNGGDATVESYPTRERRPDVRPNRINLDTGLVSGGRLTAAVFDGLHVEAIHLFQVRSAGL